MMESTEVYSNFAKERLVWVLEKQDASLTLKRSDKDYILEGIAAVFGVENENHRIYEEKEYLPHLDYLQKKIEGRRLVGELDHPEKFDVTLKNISHIVEALDYDKAGRQLKIRIRLLNGHPAGEMAKAIVAAGIPISISSRAAGVVRENKRVQLKKIFTYDLVADGGFGKSAELQRIDEGLHNGLSHIKDSSIENHLENISESLGYGKNGGVKIYNIPDEKREEFLGLLEGQTNNNKEMTNFVTVEELNGYSAVIKTELDTLKEKIKATPGITAVEEAVKSLTEKIAKIETYTKYLAENLDKNISYSEYLAENVDKGIEYAKYLAENLDRNITYAEYLAENLDKNISYSEYLAENLDKNISYSEYLAENLDKGISFSNYLAENLEKGIAYAEYLAENLDKNISYSEYLAENVDKNISYAEYLAENLDKGIQYSDYLAENLDRGISYSEYVAEKLEKNILYSEYIAESVSSGGEANVANAPKVNEKVQTKKAPIYEGLSTKIDALLEQVKKQKTKTAANESQYHFFRFLSEGKRVEFDTLDETKKQKVVNALSDNAYFTEADVTRKWDKALVEKLDVTPKYILTIPEEYKAVYEALSQPEKDAIAAQSENFKLDTDYQIRNFWQTRKLKKQKIVGLVKLNEQESAAVASVPAGYKNEYVAGVADELGKRFRNK